MYVMLVNSKVKPTKEYVIYVSTPLPSFINELFMATKRLVCRLVSPTNIITLFTRVESRLLTIV